jgi:hypothetical protein
VLVNPDHYNLNESLIAEKMQRERNERRARARAEKARQPSEADRKAAAKVLASFAACMFQPLGIEPCRELGRNTVQYPDGDDPTPTDRLTVCDEHVSTYLKYGWVLA